MTDKVKAVEDMTRREFWCGERVYFGKERVLSLEPIEGEIWSLYIDRIITGMIETYRECFEGGDEIDDELAEELATRLSNNFLLKFSDVKREEVPACH